MKTQVLLENEFSAGCELKLIGGCLNEV